MPMAELRQSSVRMFEEKSHIHTFCKKLFDNQNDSSLIGVIKRSVSKEKMLQRLTFGGVEESDICILVRAN